MILFVRSVVIFLLLNSLNANSQTSKYIKVPSGYFMVLAQGDTVFTELERFALKEKIPSANFTGMGFVNIEFGFFKAKTKTYKSRKYRNMELASMLGSLAWQNEKPSLHIHGAAGNRSFKTRSGHILSATVSTGSLEIMILVHDTKLQRKKDEALGANVLQLQD